MVLLIANIELFSTEIFWSGRLYEDLSRRRTSEVPYELYTIEDKQILILKTFNSNNNNKRSSALLHETFAWVLI